MQNTRMKYDDVATNPIWWTAAIFKIVFGYISAISCFTDLGVSYDDKLRFKPHIDQMLAKASLRAKLILKRFQSRDPKLLTIALCVFVRPMLEYASVISNPHHKNQISKIEGLQRFSANDFRAYGHIHIAVD